MGLLAAITVVCLLFGVAPRRYHTSADQMPLSVQPVEAGWYEIEQATIAGAPIVYRWTRGAGRIVLPNPGGAILLQLKLAAGAGRSTSATLATNNQRISVAVSGDPRTYQLLLAPEPDELISLRIESPTFAEPDGRQNLGLILADVTLIGGGSPVQMVLLSALLAGLATYLVLQRSLRPNLAVGVALAVQMGSQVWYAWAGWVQGTFGATQMIIVASIALAALAFNLARSGEIELPRATRLSGRVIAGWVVLVAIFLSVTIWMLIVFLPRIGSDFRIYLWATERALGGQNPYQPFRIGRTYIYPPPILALFAPFTSVTFSSARLFWFILSVLALIGSLFALRRTFRIARPLPFDPTWLFILALSFTPLWEGLGVGQVDTLILLGICLYMLGHHDQRWAWVGDLGLAGAIIIKLTPLLLLALPLLRRDWPRCLRVGAGLVGISLITLPWAGPGRWADFLVIMPLLFGGSNVDVYNLALAAVGFRSGGLVLMWLGRALAAALLLLWLLLCAWDRRGDPRPLLALGVLAMILSSSLVWYHHLFFLVVPAAWLLLGSADTRPALTALVGMVLLQLARPVEFGLGLGPWFAVVGYALVLGAAVVGMRRAIRPEFLSR
jgi:hypothetical protein